MLLEVAVFEVGWQCDLLIFLCCVCLLFRKGACGLQKARFHARVLQRYRFLLTFTNMLPSSLFRVFGFSQTRVPVQ